MLTSEVMFRFLPNVLTSLNLLAGSVAVFFAFNGQFRHTAFLVVFAAIFDFLDGTLARLLNARSELGKQLDSLADVVSFGLVPSIIMYWLMASSTGFTMNPIGGFQVAALPAFLIVLCSALRLARFNLDPVQQHTFRGLPTPADALFIVSLPFVHLKLSGLYGADSAWLLTGNYLFLVVLTLILCLMMISDIPLMGFKFKTWELKSNRFRYLFIVLSLILVFAIGMLASPLILLFYFVFSAFHHRSAIPPSA